MLKTEEWSRQHNQVVVRPAELQPHKWKSVAAVIPERRKKVLNYEYATQQMFDRRGLLGKEDLEMGV